MLLAVLVTGVSVVGHPAGADIADPYGADPNHDEGYRDQVCRWNRSGRIFLMGFIRHMFPLVHDVQGYACREIAGSAADGCNGQWEPVFSICWSTHASGRAIDIVVGGGLNEPVAGGVQYGDEIVTWFLQNHKGIDNYFVRVMGIQQILWNRRCWSASRPEDRTVTNAGAMRQCGIGNHDNHVHLTLSNAGADGQTSWFANPEPRDAAIDLDLEELVQDLVPDDLVTGDLLSDDVHYDDIPPDPVTAAATNS